MTASVELHGANGEMDTANVIKARRGEARPARY